MYKCVRLTKKNLACFKKLNDKRIYFNPLNKDFFKKYYNYNFGKQLLMRRKVRLIKDNFRYIGYIWADSNYKKDCRINAINIVNENMTDFLPFKYLINSIKKNFTTTYLCQKKNDNFFILESIGFKKKEGTLILKMKIDKNIPLELNTKLDFHIFQKGIDEGLRCDIQNRIFYDEHRVPLTLEDIYYDELQNYYFEKGAIFLKKDNKFIGYGQIILENNFMPVIVNFGIIKEYRGCGYSKYLLKYLLKISYLNGFNKIKIKVKSSNYIAVNLYKSMGFKIESEIYKFIL
ncbi:ribosomal protein S18 acetylase RimI-like enzyme [Clostridium algifaecis]|uniref:Ribosomal protein S18 acetylase RimI-like enzyme n=1 Tax=Clostridium algifaecis TaxID=1472040 RepID=A0ABS4KP73_9CLOT|nr:GNAT family N-acetyltransferase [Clostridium algifaecis]MBP2031843.1 ribosomal protein S18 acetylase RimI-like enzyme [Clostridium algifaecis]